jgi:short-subunit dehydrogenase
MVITGASSGIGLATAYRAAREGAAVVLAARNEEALRDATERIRASGGRASYVVADVSKRDDVQAIAEAALREHGGFDTWVNDAGTAIYGEVMEVPLEEQRRLFDVNFWGVVYGSRIAVEHLRERGGTLINVGSVTSHRSFPLLGVYSATKHAVKAFTDALRMELEKEGAPIAVTLIKPASIDTPFAEHARSHLGVEPRLPPPVYAPEVVADAIVTCATKARREITVGGGAQAIVWMEKLAPRLVDRLMRAGAFGAQKKSEPATREDALDSPPRHEGVVHGRERLVFSRSLYTTFRLHPLPTLAVALAGLGALFAVRALARR